MRLAAASTPTVARLAATCLALEAFVVLFAVLAAVGLSDVPDRTVWSRGGALAVAFLLLARFTRRRFGLVIGSLLQVVLVATGFVVPAMFFLGPVFAAIWFWFLSLGSRIDSDRAARAREATATREGQ